MLPYVIDEAQSGFVPDRIITNNVLIAFETFHWLQKGVVEDKNSWHLS